MVDFRIEKLDVFLPVKVTPHCMNKILFGIASDVKCVYLFLLFSFSPWSRLFIFIFITET